MVPSRLVPSLAAAADSAINSVLRTGAVRHGQKLPTGEVGFVAALVLAGVPAIARAWRPILKPAGYSLVMSGVFCHQSPMATFTDNDGVLAPCELADLLVVVDDLTSGRPGCRWAVLIQAKMAAPGGGDTLSDKRDLRQLDLLSRWPGFTLPAAFSPGSRDFSTCAYPGTVQYCGRYGLIAQQPNPLWHQQAPAKTMPAGGDELGTFLAHMIEAGQTGFGREATGVSDDWSRTVEELMTITYASVFNYTAGFGGPQPRGQMAFALSSAPFGFEALHPFILRGPPPPSGGRPEQPVEDAPGEGISILRIGISGRDAKEG